jgi:hypothetical protein
MGSVPLYYFDPQPLRARADGRFGLEDCWQHPQVWVEKFGWAPAIMRKPSALVLPDHRYRFLWWTPVLADYVLLQGSAFADFGKLNQDATKHLKDLQVFISERVRKFEEQNQSSTIANMRFYEASMRSTCTRLQDCPMTFRDVVGQVAEFQRLALDLLGMLDYMDIFHHRTIDYSCGHPSADSTRMGCFTSNPEVAHRLFLAALPVWLIRFDYSLPPTIKIKSVVAYTPPSKDIVVDDWHNQSGNACPYPVLHHGTSGADRHKASRQLGRAFADLPDLEPPVIDSSIGKATPSTSSSTGSSRPAPCKSFMADFAFRVLTTTISDPQHTRGKKNKNPSTHRDIHVNLSGGNNSQTNPGANRDKWEDVASDLIPPDIPFWTTALRTVDRNRARIRLDLPVQDKGYAFPDPNSLAALPPDKQAQKLCAWLSLRGATCAGVFTQAGRKPPTGSGAIWRVATDWNQIAMIPDHPDYPAINNDKKSKAAKLRHAVKHLFGEKLLAKLRGDVEIVEWHEVELQVRDHAIVDLDHKIVKEIIWELFEHNFRYEIVALDMAAAPSKWLDDESAVARKEKISMVFGLDGKFVIWSDPFPRRNTGLQANNISDRLPCLENLREVQNAWPNVPSNLRGASFSHVSCSGKQIEDLERDVAKFYCQTFFDYFGRPPIVPHRIPHHADDERQRDLQEQNIAAMALTRLAQS